MKKGIFLSLFLSSTFASDYQIHILEEGETLSELLHAKGYSPLYGKDNWVDKALQMNHLKSVHAKEIKKGFPIILPHRNSPPITKHELTKLRNSILNKKNYSVTKLHSFNKVSKHQEVSFSVALGQNNLKIDKTEITQKEHFTFELNIKGKNNYQFNNIVYNLFGNVRATTYGTGSYKNESNKTLSLRPSTALRAGIQVSHFSIPFYFGPSITFEEKSLVNSSENVLQTRRDQLGWMGFHIDKEFSQFQEYFKTSLSYERKTLQNSLSDAASYEASRIQFELGMHLTKNYIAGLNTTVINYSTTDLKSENAIALKFDYLIK